MIVLSFYCINILVKSILSKFTLKLLIGSVNITYTIYDLLCQVLSTGVIDKKVM